MPKVSPEMISARRNEIIAACEELYKTKGFKDVTIRDIGKITSCTRTTIYNFFQTEVWTPGEGDADYDDPEMRAHAGEIHGSHT